MRKFLAISVLEEYQDTLCQFKINRRVVIWGTVFKSILHEDSYTHQNFLLTLKRSDHFDSIDTDEIIAVSQQNWLGTIMTC